LLCSLLLVVLYSLIIFHDGVWSTFIKIIVIVTLNTNRSPVQNAQQHVDTVGPDQANTAELNSQ